MRGSGCKSNDGNIRPPGLAMNNNWLTKATSWGWLLHEIFCLLYEIYGRFMAQATRAFRARLACRRVFLWQNLPKSLAR
jgi:hypothetical protein